MKTMRLRFYYVEGLAGWRVFMEKGQKEARAVGNEVFGKGNIVTVRLASRCEIESYNQRRATTYDT